MKNARFDPTLKTYLEIIETSSNFKSKIIYALRCIHNCVQPTTPNLIPNQIYLVPRLPSLIPLAEIYTEPSLLEIMIGILNKINHPESFPLCLKILHIIKDKKL